MVNSKLENTRENTLIQKKIKFSKKMCKRSSFLQIGDPICKSNGFTNRVQDINDQILYFLDFSPQNLVPQFFVRNTRFACGLKFE